MTEPPSRAAVAHLWIEGFRRQLGRPRMTDDDYERLGHAAIAATMPDDEYERLGHHVYADDGDPLF